MCSTTDLPRPSQQFQSLLICILQSKSFQQYLNDVLCLLHVWSSSSAALSAACCPPVPGGVSMESCSACPAGHYCSTEGQARPTGPCAAGFYCPFDFSSTTPYAFLCPKVRVIHTLSRSYFLTVLPPIPKSPVLSFPSPLSVLFPPQHRSLRSHDVNY